MKLPIPSGFGVRCLAGMPARFRADFTASRPLMEQGSAPPAATSDDSDALDAVEVQVWRRFCDDADVPSIAQIRAFIAESCTNSPPRLYSDPPPIDPSEGRHSAAEILCLLDVLAGAFPKIPQVRTRAGYVLGPKGFRPNEPGVEPAFVAALGAPNLRELFPDLWAIDALLWDKLDAASPKELARLWLESPGRRLVQDLRVLDLMPVGGKLGTTNFSPARIDAAIGLQQLGERDFPTFLRAHHEFYLAVAGEQYLSLWEPQPLPEEKTKQIMRALKLLEEGSPLGLRGAALRWLLDTAVDKPHYDVEGSQRDLREDLAMRLGTALGTWLPDTNKEPIFRRLETLALHHAARFIGTDSTPEAVKRAWAIARWLQGCLRRSPFFGGDEEVLAAHLEARLSKQTLPNNADALHPLRFSLNDDGLNVAEVAFLAGLIVHYQQAREPRLLPTPLPIVHALQRLADRPVTDAEVMADQARLAGQNALGWPAEYPLMLPVAARRLMSERRIGWLRAVGQEAQIDTLQRFLSDPEEFRWMAFALQREGKHLKPEAKTFAVQVFHDLARSDRAKPHLLGTFAAGILGELSDDGISLALDIVDRSEPPWGPFVMDAIAGALEPVTKNNMWTLVIEKLIRCLEDVEASDKFRLNAALFAMRHISASRAPNREALLQRVAASSGVPPFSTHAGLQAEFRRLGLAKSNIARAKR